MAGTSGGVGLEILNKKGKLTSEKVVSDSRARLLRLVKTKRENVRHAVIVTAYVMTSLTTLNFVSSRRIFVARSATKEDCCRPLIVETRSCQ